MNALERLDHSTRGGAPWPWPWPSKAQQSPQSLRSSPDAAESFSKVIDIHQNSVFGKGRVVPGV